MNRLFQTAAWRLSWIASALLAACSGSGTVVVGFLVDPEVVVSDSDGKAEAPGAVVTAPGRPPFNAVQYRGKDFEWTFSAGSHGAGGWIRNRSEGRLCMRFDQAQIRSNFHSEPVELRAYSWAVYRETSEAWSVLGTTDPRKREYFTPPSFCLEPGTEARIMTGLDLRQLFPTQKMFNVSWPGNDPQLSDKGIGNRVALSVPLEVGKKRQIVSVKLTAVDSQAKISYH
jgi:hypothetical protein